MVVTSGLLLAGLAAFALRAVNATSLAARRALGGTAIMLFGLACLAGPLIVGPTESRLARTIDAVGLKLTFIGVAGIGQYLLRDSSG